MRVYCGKPTASGATCSRFGSICPEHGRIERPPADQSIADRLVVEVGDRVARISKDHYNGTRGTVTAIAHRPGRWSGREADKIPKARMKVRWDADGRFSWLAVDAEGKRWRKLTLAETDREDPT